MGWAVRRQQLGQQVQPFETLARLLLPVAELEHSLVKVVVDTLAVLAFQDAGRQVEAQEVGLTVEAEVGLEHKYVKVG